MHYIRDDQICIMLCADHGPCVSGAHNSIVTARAGKDLVSCLVSGKQWTLVFLMLKYACYEQPCLCTNIPLNGL